MRTPRRPGGTGRRWAVVLAAIALSGCRPSPPPRSATGIERFDPDLVDGQRALAETAALVALGPREAGTPGAERAAAHIRSRLEAAGIEARIECFEDDVPGGRAVFRNVIGRLPGRGEGLIVLGSHYDTKSGMPEGFEGANDSGSSTGLLIELARVFREGPVVGPEIRWVFLDGEECRVAYGPRDGLHGSRHLARQLVEEGRAKDVRAVLVLDMVGDRDLTFTLPRNQTPALLRRLLAAARAENVRERCRLLPHDVLDDHEPFLRAGLPAALLMDFEYGRAPGLNDYWHTAEDRLDKLSAESLTMAGRVVVRFVNNLLPAP